MITHSPATAEHARSTPSRSDGQPNARTRQPGALPSGTPDKSNALLIEADGSYRTLHLPQPGPACDAELADHLGSPHHVVPDTGPCGCAVPVTVITREDSTALPCNHVASLALGVVRHAGADYYLRGPVILANAEGPGTGMEPDHLRLLQLLVTALRGELDLPVAA